MTITVLSKRIRDALAQSPDGLTSREIAVMLNVDVSQISRSLTLMPDVYIDRWTSCKNKYTSVHCLAFVPDDCPYPVR
jgi:hypothetical protein